MCVMAIFKYNISIIYYPINTMINNKTYTSQR